MKKSTSFFVVILPVILGLALNNDVSGQWEPDVRLTNAPGISYPSYNNARNITANGDTLHEVWFDNRDGYYAIYYKRSTNGGTTWEGDIALTNSTMSISMYPSISVYGNFVHVVWHDDRNGGYEVYYRRSIDGGSTWETDQRLTNAPAFSGYPSLAVHGNILHLTWYDQRDGNYEIYYKRSTDGGVTWEPDMRLTGNPAVSYSPSIAVNGTVVHLVWYDTSDGNEEIYYKRSTNGGLTWEADVRLTNDPAFSDNTSIAVSGSYVHVTWMDTRDGNYEIYYIRSTDEGLNWEPETRLTWYDGSSYNPSIVSSGLNVHCVWYDSREGNYEIFYKRSTDGGINWEDDMRLTEDQASSAFPFIAVSDSLVHVTWQDGRDGNPEIYYKRNPNGNLATITGSTTPCQGSSQVYSVPEVAGVTETWSFPSGWTITAGQGTNMATVTVGAISGTIFMTPTSGPPGTLPVTVLTVPAQPSPITGNTSPHAGTTGLNYSVTSVPDVTYDWTVPSGWIITGGNGTSSITVTAGSSPGIIEVVPSNECGTGISSTLAVTVIVSVDEATGSHHKFTISPNPARDKIKISPGDLSGSYKITMTDMTGRVVLIGGFTGNSSIDAGNLNSGVYLVTITLENVQVYRSKLLLNK